MEALKALAHPLRVRIFSELTSYGPATASALAARLGESSGSTSYHLRQLEKHGYVREDAGRGNGRDRWWERVPGPIELADATFADSEAAREAGELVESEFIDNEKQRFGGLLGEPATRCRPSGASNADTVRQPRPHRGGARAARRGLGSARGPLPRSRRRRPERRRVDIHLRAFPVIDPTTTTQQPISPDDPEGAQR